MKFRINLIGIVVIVIAIGAGVYLYRAANTVDVDISSYFKDASIQLAVADRADESQVWFDVTPGPSHLRRGAYAFRLKKDKNVRVGIIAVEDSTPIVLK